ncbi:ORF22 [Leucania separata nucleopolyhedrovirus]|uniref:ORF22 n=1 Tax=Leucania separata nucleopolyhedrovirus TaxID=1307956 RepID=Q0IL97_NPVLS|nr:ORF22 [Leucania separata nucleopolyhedrovirus]AAR28786.1 ORF22 [Leucania separata nucleopolyhedrovirus]
MSSKRKPVNMYIMYRRDYDYGMLSVKSILKTMQLFVKILPDNGLDISTNRHHLITDCDEGKVEELQYFMNRFEFPSVNNKKNTRRRNKTYILDSKLYDYCSNIIDKPLLESDEYRVVDYLQHWALTYELRGYESTSAVERDHDTNDQNISPVAAFVRQILVCHHLICDDDCPYKFDRADYCNDFDDNYFDSDEDVDTPSASPPPPRTGSSVANRYAADEIREAIRRSPNHLLVEYERIERVPAALVARRLVVDERYEHHLYSDESASEPFASLYDLTTSPLRNVLGDGSNDYVGFYKRAGGGKGIVMGSDHRDESLNRDAAIDHNVLIPDLIYKHSLSCNETALE